MNFNELRKRVIEKVEPVLVEATQRCNWWEVDYNEQAHVEITLTIAEVRALAVLKELCKSTPRPRHNKNKKGE